MESLAVAALWLHSHLRALKENNGKKKTEQKTCREAQQQKAHAQSAIPSPDIL